MKKLITLILTLFMLGSFALADNKTKIFALSIGTYLDVICEVFNNQGIPRLIDINGDHFKGITDYPKMVHGDIEDVDMQSFATFVKEMVGTGVLIPDEQLEDEVRRVGGLPERMTTDTPPYGVQPSEYMPQAAAEGGVTGQNGPETPKNGPQRVEKPKDDKIPQDDEKDAQEAKMARKSINRLFGR